MSWESGRLPSKDREILLYTPVRLPTSHFESSVDKLGSSEMKCDAMIKRTMSRHPGNSKQSDATVKLPASHSTV